MVKDAVKEPALNMFDETEPVEEPEVTKVLVGMYSLHVRSLLRSHLTATSRRVLHPLRSGLVRLLSATFLPIRAAMWRILSRVLC